MLEIVTEVEDWRETGLLGSAPDARSMSKIVEGPLRVRDKEGNLLLAVDQAESLFEKYEHWVSRVDVQEGERTQGLKVRSRVFGFSPPNEVTKRNCGSQCSIHYDQPDVAEKLLDLSSEMSDWYMQTCPEQHARHSSAASEILDCWKIRSTPFTMGIVNRDAALRYHRDQGNYRQTNNVMLAWQKGTFGGELCIPAIDLAVRLSRPSIFLFDGHRLLHGVSRLVAGGSGCRRYSVVCYTIKRMAACGDPVSELQRARSVRSTRERRRAGLEGGSRLGSANGEIRLDKAESIEDEGK